MFQRIETVRGVGLGSIITASVGIGQSSQHLWQARHSVRAYEVWTAAALRPIVVAMQSHIEAITDLLLGAAYADKRLQDVERRTVTATVCKLLEVDELPANHAERIRAFNPAKFDVTAVAASLRELTDEQRANILELVAHVVEADTVLDLDEDVYVRKVAAGLGLEAEAAELFEVIPPE